MQPFKIYGGLDLIFLLFIVKRYIVPGVDFTYLKFYNIVIHVLYVYADVAESADALDLGSSVIFDIGVQVPSSAPFSLAKA